MVGFETASHPVVFKFRSAIVAFFIQVISALLIFVPVYFFKLGAQFVFTPFVLICVQAGFSAVLTYLFRLESWWVLIGFLLPFCFMVAVVSGLSSWTYIVVFFVLFFVYGATFHSRVPYFPSPDQIPVLLCNVLPAQPFSFLDVGSGFGKVLIRLCRKLPKSRFYGVELAIAPFFFSLLRGKLFGLRNFSVKLGDFQQLSFADYDVVYAYLSPVIMDDVWVKACAEMRHGTLFISYEFNVHGRKPDFEIQCQETGAFLYGWKM